MVSSDARRVRRQTVKTTGTRRTVEGRRGSRTTELSSRRTGGASACAWARRSAFHTGRRYSGPGNSNRGVRSTRRSAPRALNRDHPVPATSPPLRHGEFVALDLTHGQERRPCHRTAVRAVAVIGRYELVRDLVGDGFAGAATTQHDATLEPSPGPPFHCYPSVAAAELGLATISPSQVGCRTGSRAAAAARPNRSPQPRRRALPPNTSRAGPAHAKNAARPLTAAHSPPKPETSQRSSWTKPE